MNTEQNIEQYYEVELRQPLAPGDVLWTWCSVHYVQTDHLWTGKRLICLECYPEYKPIAVEEETNYVRQ